MWGVMRFYNLLRIGVTWKGPEIIELWYHPSDSSKESAIHNKDDDDVTSVLCRSSGGSGGGRLRNRPGICENTYHGPHNNDVEANNNNNDDDDDDLIITDDEDDADNKSANNSGSDEDDSLLVAYDSNSVASVWHNVKSCCNFCDQTNNIQNTSKGWTIFLVIFIATIELYAQIILLY